VATFAVNAALVASQCQHRALTLPTSIHNLTYIHSQPYLHPFTTFPTSIQPFLHPFNLSYIHSVYVSTAR